MREAVAITLAAVVAGAGCKGSGVPAGEVAAVTAAAAATEIATAVANSGAGGSVYDPEAERPVDKPRTLDVEHAKAVLLATDVSACWPHSGTHGPADVSVAFRPNGTVRNVSVTSGLVAECAERKLREVIVDPFDDVRSFAPSPGGFSSPPAAGVVRVTFEQP